MVLVVVVVVVQQRRVPHGSGDFILFPFFYNFVVLVVNGDTKLLRDYK